MSGGKLGLLAGGVVLAASGGAAAIGLARKNGSDSDAGLAQMLQNSAISACADYQLASAQVASFDQAATELRQQLAALQAAASQRHAYIDNVARPGLIAERNKQLAQGSVAVVGTLPSFAPGEIAAALGFATGGWGFLLPAAVGAVFAMVAWVDSMNVITMDQIDQAIAQSHANVDARLAADSKLLQDQLDTNAAGRAAAAAQAASAKGRVDSFESAMNQHDPPIPFTPCGGSSP